MVRLDADLASTLHGHATEPATAFFQVATLLGNAAMLTAVAMLGAGYLTLRGGRADAVLLIASLGGAHAVTWMLKVLFQRERPSFDEPLATATSFSFPSGHALVSLAVYGALAFVLARRVHSAQLRAAWLAGTTLLVVAVGFSRLYLGVHYLSDVLAGYSIGLALLLATIGVVRAAAAARQNRKRPLVVTNARI